MLPTVPARVQFIRQTGDHGDCGVSTLAMLAGLPYADSLAACVSIQPAALHTGLTWAQMRAAAKILGLKVRVTSRYNIDSDTGILNVAKLCRNGRKTGEHLVFLWEGRIVEGNGELWLEPAAYLKHCDYTAYKLMVID